LREEKLGPGIISEEEEEKEEEDDEGGGEGNQLFNPAVYQLFCDLIPFHARVHGWVERRGLRKTEEEREGTE